MFELQRSRTPVALQILGSEVYRVPWISLRCTNSPRGPSSNPASIKPRAVQAIRLGQRLPEVNVVVSFVILVTIIPVVIAARLTGGGGIARTTTAR
jgi:hypothetical protein